MGSTFADSDYGDTVETQLTLGTISLLGIFFGLVMVCGIFFGFGYSLGRRNGVTSASAAAAAPTRVSPVISRPAPAIPTPAAPVQPDLPMASLTPAAPAQQPALVAAAPTVTKPIPQAAPTQTLVLDAQVHIPKPSAIQPVLDQPNTRIPLQKPVAGPQFTAQNLPSPYFVWTPPFDVKRHHGVTRRVYDVASQAPLPSGASPLVNPGSPQVASLHYTSAARTSVPGPALTVQIAAMSRQDDAEVLASALRQRGFSPSIKSGAEDALYHVQVGPFSRDVAFATRQRLIAKGYNAILK
jgi:hypothetical protein